MVPPDSLFDLSIRVDACDDLIHGCVLFLSFDPTVVELVAAAEGSLYAECGFSTWFTADELEPGSWRLFDTILGSGTYVVPPGELFHVTFLALDYGYTQAHIDDVQMTNADDPPQPIYGITYEHGHIFVTDPTGLEDGVHASPGIGPARPNPFQEETAIAFSLPYGGDWRVDVYDAGGRHVRRMAIPGEPGRGSFVWDGRTTNGAPAAAGVYFVVLHGGDSAAQTRIVKLN
jgi:hypothetical protein